MWTIAAKPVAYAGPDEVTIEGTSLILDASGSLAPDAEIVSYEWDLNYDGVTFDVDAVGLQLDFDASDGPAMATIGLRVTDAQGFTSIVSKTVSVTNAPPEIRGLRDTSALPNEQLRFAAQVTDAGAADTLSIQWDLGDGTTINDVVDVTHTYAEEGEYFASVTVTDSDGAVTIKSFRVVVGPPATVTASATELEEGQVVTLTASLEASL